MIVDHIQPKALGGADTWDNLQTLCRTCHGLKGRYDGTHGRREVSRER
jgi:5-methylcytosine-specific restriction endonuclease McrA